MGVLVRIGVIISSWSKSTRPDTDGEVGTKGIEKWRKGCQVVRFNRRQGPIRKRGKPIRSNSPQKTGNVSFVITD